MGGREVQKLPLLCTVRLEYSITLKLKIFLKSKQSVTGKLLLPKQFYIIFWYNSFISSIYNNNPFLVSSVNTYTVNCIVSFCVNDRVLISTLLLFLIVLYDSGSFLGFYVFFQVLYVSIGKLH